MRIPSSPLALFALGCAALAAAILVAYLIRRPALGHATFLWLLFGVGVLPLGVAVSGNVHGYEATKQRTFCGSCHVMSMHAADAGDRASTSLSSRHARNALVGDESCYACHADYGMFGTITTKLGGMRHVWLYATQFRDTPMEEAKRTIRIRRPFSNATCMHCHSTEVPLWRAVPDHASSLDDVRADRVSCASEGCHGLAHPYFGEHR